MMTLSRTERISLQLLLLATLAITVTLQASAQDTFSTLITTGAASIRLAAANFRPQGTDPQTGQLKSTFDTVLAADLANAGVFDLVSKSLQPTATPGSPAEIQLAQWSSAPASAAFVAFGSLGVQGGRLMVNGFLFDTKNTQFPQVLSQQYTEDATVDSARQIAHRFADEIILRLGGGIPGIAETKIYYVHLAGGTKEIWEMDYDGANQHPVTHLGTISISPRVSPDNSRLAFAWNRKYGPGAPGGQDIYIMDIASLKWIQLTHDTGQCDFPSWSPDGRHIVYARSPDGRAAHTKVWSMLADGTQQHALSDVGGDMPNWSWK